ncbi:hypothetical protein GP486_001734 [Trichoglossum hirsutum]|uniref:Translation initiation factor 3 N-terminal domain-containing protein n=1 Tax=Trichoglossum hirsutum TaxID=265104 RepID=A0A9P8LG49_9PEZI|nr:hypothetical protein GP486_001734 [Trichoglossum hirsutum]
MDHNILTQRLSRMKGIECLSAMQSLCKVFINSNGSAQPTSNLFVHATFLRPSARLVPPASVRIRPYAQAAPLKRRLPRDEEISASNVHLVDEHGTFHPPTPVRKLLASFDRKLYHLVAVAPIESGQIPICKIVPRKELRDRERAKPVKNPANIVKQLELNWAIDSNDLGHRLNKMREFLEKGMRVEVILANKRKGRKANAEEAAAVVRRIREKITEVEGAREWRSADGRVMGQMTMFLQGNVKI